MLLIFLVIRTNSDVDHVMSGIELFEKYIAYNLDESISIGTHFLKDNVGNYDYKIIVSPYPYIYELTNATLRDSLLITFAVLLHNKRLFKAAIKIYELFLAQQNNLKSIDCILIRYYLELAKARCTNRESICYLDEPFEIDTIITDLINVQDDLKNKDEIISSIEESIMKQKEYFDKYNKILTLLNFDNDISKAIDNMDNVNNILESYRKKSVTLANKLFEKLKNQINSKKDSIMDSLLNHNIDLCFDNYDLLKTQMKKIIKVRNDFVSTGNFVYSLNENLLNKYEYLKKKINYYEEIKSKLDDFFPPNYSDSELNLFVKIKNSYRYKNSRSDLINNLNECIKFIKEEVKVQNQKFYLDRLNHLVEEYDKESKQIYESYLLNKKLYNNKIKKEKTKNVIFTIVSIILMITFIGGIGLGSYRLVNYLFGNFFSLGTSHWEQLEFLDIMNGVIGSILEFVLLRILPFIGVCIISSNH